MRQRTYKHQNHRERQLAPAVHSRTPANDSCLPSNASTTSIWTDIPAEETTISSTVRHFYASKESTG